MKRIIIIGGGPRGLFALESVYRELAEFDITANTIIFDEKGLFGSSHVYDISQPDTNWINISERLLEIPKRSCIRLRHCTIPAFPSYNDWANNFREEDTKLTIDTYPPRSFIGKYLIERFNSIASVLMEAGLLTCVAEKVTQVSYYNGSIEVKRDSGEIYFADELLMTIGHQPVRRPEQVKKWQNHASQNSGIHFFEFPYPIDDILKDKELLKGKTIALKGFGLAMIDVVRALTIGLRGKFETEDENTKKVKYIPAKETPAKLIPFSLDGLPPSPKPIDHHVDSTFEPSEEGYRYFKEKVRTALRNSAAIKDPSFLIDPFAKVTADIYKGLKTSSYTKEINKDNIEDLIKEWVCGNWPVNRVFVSKGLSPHNAMKEYIGMACGLSDVSLDYCIGQVWRHLQPLMYELLSYPKYAKEVINDIVEIDERLKRYSYGPPVESIQQVLALIEAHVLTIRAIDDPDIITDSKGWTFSLSGYESLSADIMIDTVLASPIVEQADSLLIKGLLEKGTLQPLHSNLGVLTKDDGQVITTEGKPIPIAFIGRLAKGSLLGVDAILECFGDPIDNWSKGLIERHVSKIYGHVTT